jgi:RHS repeat-associated protein
MVVLAFDNRSADYADAEDSIVYYTNDANFNVTALVDESGNVIERYAYDPYGERTVLDADFSADADGLSDVDNNILYAGYHFDPETTLYHVRNRMYDSELGRWIQRDPLGYVDGMSVYEYVRSTPVNLLDSMGQEAGLGYRRPGEPLIDPDWGKNIKPDLTRRERLAKRQTEALRALAQWMDRRMAPILAKVTGYQDLYTKLGDAIQQYEHRVGESDDPPCLFLTKSLLTISSGQMVK